MTTTLPYNPQPTPIEELISFDPDPGPLPDAMQQDLPLQEFLHILSDRFTNFGRVPDIFLSSNTFICYDPNDLKRSSVARLLYRLRRRRGGHPQA